MRRSNDGFVGDLRSRNTGVGDRLVPGRLQCR